MTKCLLCGGKKQKNWIVWGYYTMDKGVGGMGRMIGGSFPVCNACYKRTREEINKIKEKEAPTSGDGLNPFQKVHQTILY